MREETSSGFLLFQQRPRRSFLVLCHGGDKAGRLDLPKGRLKRGETELEAAHRELEEEAGVAAHELAMIDGFRYVSTYVARIRGEKTKKTVVLFAATVEGPAAIHTPDHETYAWYPWPLSPKQLAELEPFPTLHGAVTAFAVFEHQRHAQDRAT